MLSENIKKSIVELAKKYNLKLVMLFGSEAKGRANEKSDLDIAILGDKNFYENKYADFSFEMSKIENEEKREIEIVPISNGNLLLLYNIFNDGIILYARTMEEYLKTLSWARFSYEDNKRFFYGREKMFKERLKRI